MLSIKVRIATMFHKDNHRIASIMSCLHHKIHLNSCSKVTIKDIQGILSPFSSLKH